MQSDYNAAGDWLYDRNSLQMRGDKSTRNRQMKREDSRLIA